MAVGAIVGLLLLLSFYKDCTGRSDSVSCISSPMVTANPSCTNDTSSGDSWPLKLSLEHVLAIAGGSVAVGITIILLIIAFVAIRKRAHKRRIYGSQATLPVTRKATTSRRRSTKASQNGSNLNHNYETVLPNFKKPAEKVQQQAQQYEVPLSQSTTLTQSFTTGSHNQTGGSFRLHDQNSEKECPKVKSREPVYMNTQALANKGRYPVNTRRPLQCSIVNPAHLKDYGFENNDCEEREMRLVMSSESWAV